MAQHQGVQSNAKKTEASVISNDDKAETKSLSDKENNGIANNESTVHLPIGYNDEDDGLGMQRLKVQYPSKQTTPNPMPMMTSQDNNAPVANTRGAKTRNRETPHGMRQHR